MITISGRVIDLANVTKDDIDISDIAHGLSKIFRYNGHTSVEYTVAEHSLIMSYLLEGTQGPVVALEALLHDASEAYIGDMIRPLKDLFPAIEVFESKMTLTIMDVLHPMSCLLTVDHRGGYQKSTAVSQLDTSMVSYETRAFRPHVSMPADSVDPVESAFFNMHYTVLKTRQRHRGALQRLFEDRYYELKQEIVNGEW